MFCPMYLLLLPSLLIFVALDAERLFGPQRHHVP